MRLPPSLVAAAVIALVAPAICAAAKPSKAAHKASGGHKRPAGKSKPALDPASRSSVQFGLRLFREIVRDVGTANLLVSPTGLGSALALACSGASGKTREAIASTLAIGPGADGVEVGGAWQSSLSALGQGDPKVKLSVASSIWIDESVGLRPGFAQTDAAFGVELRPARLAARATADQINRWAAEKNANQILSVVPSPLPEETAVALVSAIYFKGQWARAFEKAKVCAFQVPLFEPVEVPMMSQAGTFAHAHLEDVQAVALPYDDGRFAMLVLLPRPEVSFVRFVEGLDADRFEAIAGALKPATGEVVIPRFKFECGKELSGALGALGMAPAFEAGADFSPMIQGPAKLGRVYHRALIEVTEEGTTAPAATPPAIGRHAMAVTERFELRADRPFVFAVRDTSSGALLFVGALSDPRG
jgi:serpin B